MVSVCSTFTQTSDFRLVRLESSLPDQERTSLRQSVFLHSAYYSSFIAGHRASLLDTHSLLSSVKAARACIDAITAANAIGEGKLFPMLLDHTTDLLVSRSDTGGSWTNLSVFLSAYCIQLGIWSTIPELSDKPGLTASVTAALDILSKMERKWIGAGKYKYAEALISVLHVLIIS